MWIFLSISFAKFRTTNDRKFRLHIDALISINRITSVSINHHLTPLRYLLQIDCFSCRLIQDVNSELTYTKSGFYVDMSYIIWFKIVIQWCRHDYPKEGELNFFFKQDRIFTFFSSNKKKASTIFLFFFSSLGAIYFPDFSSIYANAISVNMR